MQKAPHGIYTSEFRRFYASNVKIYRKEYRRTKDATNAQKSMLRIMSDKHIYDTRITRRRNVLYLEKEKGLDYKEQIMRRFLRVE